MTIELIRLIYDYIASNVVGISSSFAGDLSDRSSTNTDIYPILWLSLPIRIEYVDQTKTYTLDWYIMDREENTDDYSQRFKLLSKCEQLGEYVLALLNNLNNCGIVVQNNGIVDTFDEFTQDNLLGLHYTTTLTTSINTDICSDTIINPNICSIITNYLNK